MATKPPTSYDFDSKKNLLAGSLIGVVTSNCRETLKLLSGTLIDEFRGGSVIRHKQTGKSRENTFDSPQSPQAGSQVTLIPVFICVCCTIRQ